MYISTELNLGDRVLALVEKNSACVLAGKGGHSRLMLRLCPDQEGVVRSFMVMVQRGGSDQLVDILLIGWW